MIILKYGTNHDENLLELYGNIKNLTLGAKGITFIFVTKKSHLLILNVQCNQIFITMLTLNIIGSNINFNLYECNEF
jgi:hypothetical protein